MKMIIQLRDKSIEPTNLLIAPILGDAFVAYEKMRELIATPEAGIAVGWRFYNDGGAWLGKSTHKNKTIFWLSIWDGFFKVSFYFTEKTRSGVMDLNISQHIKDNFTKQKFAGKLVPLIMDINEAVQLVDLMKIIEYKKSLT